MIIEDQDDVIGNEVQEPVDANYVAERPLRRRKYIKKRELFNYLSRTKFLPRPSSHASAKKYLMRLLDNTMYGAIDKPVPECVKPLKKVGLLMLHDLTKILFAQATGFKLYHEDALGNYDYYVRMVSFLSPITFSSVFGAPDPNEDVRLALNRMQRDYDDRFGIGLRIGDYDAAAIMRQKKALDMLKKKMIVCKLRRTGSRKAAFAQRKIKRKANEKYKGILRERKMRVEIDELNREVRAEVQDLLRDVENPRDAQDISAAEQLLNEVLHTPENINSRFSALHIDGVDLKAIRSHFHEENDIHTFIEKHIQPFVNKPEHAKELLKITADSSALNQALQWLTYYNMRILLQRTEPYQYKLDTLAIMKRTAEQMLIALMNHANDPSLQKLYELHLGSIAFSKDNKDLEFSGRQAGMYLAISDAFASKERKPVDAFRLASFNRFSFDHYIVYKLHNLKATLLIDIEQQKSLLDSLCTFSYRRRGILSLRPLYFCIDYKALDDVLINAFTTALPRYKDTAVSFKLIMDAYMHHIRENNKLPQQVKAIILEQCIVEDLQFIATSISEGELNLAKFERYGKKKRRAVTWLNVVKNYFNFGEEHRIVLMELSPCTDTKNYFLEKTDDRRQQLELLLAATMFASFYAEQSEGFEEIVHSHVRTFLLRTPYSGNLGACVAQLILAYQALAFETGTIDDLFKYMKNVHNDFFVAEPYKDRHIKKGNVFLLGAHPRFTETHSILCTLLNYPDYAKAQKAYLEAVKHVKAAEEVNNPNKKKGGIFNAFKRFTKGLLS